MMQKTSYLMLWQRPKPVLLLQTNGGMYQGQPLNYTWTRDMPIELVLFIVDKVR
jgi:hypothetical protein